LDGGRNLSILSAGKTSNLLTAQEANMQKWAYAFIVCEQAKGDWRPSYINAKEVYNWKEGETMYDYCNRSGSEGWELVNFTTEFNDYAQPSRIRLCFKRPYE
jgi:hypothetical protein